MNERTDLRFEEPAPPQASPAPPRRSALRRALGCLEYAAQCEAVRPPDTPLPPLRSVQRQADEREAAGSQQPDGGPVGAALEAMAPVVEQIEEAAGFCEDAGRVLERVRVELLVAGQGPLARQAELLKGLLDTAGGALSSSVEQVARLARFRAIIDNVSLLYSSLQAAAATPIDAAVIADDPRAALDGYASYFRAASAACRLMANVPGLGDLANGLADVFEAIPNAIENLYRVFEDYHERIDSMLEGAQEVTYRFTPNTPAMVRLGNALMRDMREGSDIGYRHIPMRVRQLLMIPVVTSSLTDAQRDQAAANADDLRERFFGWMMSPNAGGDPLRVDAVEIIHSRYERFMTGTGDELRGGTPFTVIGQLAATGSAELALRHLLMG